MGLTDGHPRNTTSLNFDDFHIRDGRTLAMVLIVLWIIVAVTTVFQYRTYFCRRHVGLVSARVDESALRVAPNAAHVRLGGGEWQRNLEMGLQEILQLLLTRSDPSSVAAAVALRGLRDVARENLGERTRRIAVQAVRTGKPASVFLRTGNVITYAVIFPMRCHQPSLLRRHDAWKAGWSDHARRLAAAVHSSTPGLEILMLLIFLRPDASEEAILFGYTAADGELAVAPGLLLDEFELRALRHPPYPDLHNFSLRAD